MTPEYRQAIARITVGKARGSGFLVSDTGLVLTALHVIGDREGQPFKPYAPKINLEFGDKTKWTAVATLADSSAQDDWALLQLSEPGPPYPARPLPLAGVRFDPNPLNWETWGFPTVAAKEGTGYEGANAIQADVFEVSCISLQNSMVDGISGAPLVVGGDVCALVQRAFMGRDAQNRLRVEDSKLIARTLQSVMVAVGGRLQWDDNVELPFEAQVQEAVIGLFKDTSRLGELGRNVGVNVAEVRQELLPRKIARRALRHGLEPTYQALSDTAGPLDGKECARIVGYVAAGGLLEQPVGHVRAGLRREQDEVAVLLSVSHELIVRFFVWRARWGLSNELGAFDRYIFAIGSCPEEGEVAYLRDELRKELARVTKRQGKSLDQWIKAANPFFALVPGIVRQTVLEEVVPDFPGGRLIQFVGDPAAAQPRVRTVTAGLSADDESTIEEYYTNAETALGAGG